MVLCVIFMEYINMESLHAANFLLSTEAHTYHYIDLYFILISV